MASRSYPGWLVGTLALAAIGGWLVAWNMGRPGKTTAREPEAAPQSRVGSRNRDGGRSVSPASVIADGETARLLSKFGEINAAGVPGKVNQKLLHACRAALLDGNVNRRARNFSLLLELMRPEDGPALHDQFIELHREGKTYDEYKVMAAHWGELDAEGAIQYISSKVPMVFPDFDFQAIARGWAQKDPQAALEWVKNNPEMAKQMNAKVAVIDGWIRDDPGAAMKWIDANMASMEPREYFETMKMGTSGLITANGTGIDDAISWLVSRPKTEYSQAASTFAWRSMQWCLAEMRPEKAAAVWGQVGGQEWMQFGDFKAFSGSVSNNRLSSDGMAGLLSALGTTWPKEQVTSQFQRWTTENPEATLQWLRNAPPSDVTRAAIGGAVKALEQTDPSAAAEWTERLAE